MSSDNGFASTHDVVAEEDEEVTKEHYDDSFDSDYSDEAYSRLHPQVGLQLSLNPVMLSVDVVLQLRQIEHLSILLLFKIIFW